MGEKRALAGLCRWLLCGLLAGAAGCGRGGDGGGGSQVRADGGTQAQAPAPAIGRPADATAGPRVGVVVAATPDVRVVPSQGAPFPAAEGTMLVRDDRLSTGSGAGSFVVVELHNGHVVRFNQGTSIVVEGIAVFDAPPAGDDLAARFERVLRPEEQGDERLRGAISRVAGWNSRMTATETIAPLSASKPIVEAKRGDAPMDDADAVAGDRPEEQDDAPTLDSLTDPRNGGLDAKKAASKKNRRPGETGEQSEPPPGSEPPGQQPTPRAPPHTDQDDSKAESSKKSETQAPKPESAALDLPDQVKFVPESGAAQAVKLPAALVIGRKALAKCAGAGATLKVRIKGGVIVAIKVEGGTGATCTEGKGRGVKLADGTLEVRVSS